MGEHLDESIFITGLGSALSISGGGLFAWAMGSGTLQPPLSHVLAICGAGCALAFWLLYRRYAGMLAASALPADDNDRAGYDELRESLAAGGAMAHFYAERLKRILDRVERFFGDAGMAEPTLFPRAFGLNTPAPLWSAPAFDRCLLLALVYPIATIFVIWVISGHVGPAEAALGLNPDVPGWRRLVVLWLASLAGFAAWRSVRNEGWRSCLWCIFSNMAGLSSIIGDTSNGIFCIIIAVNCMMLVLFYRISTRKTISGILSVGVVISCAAASVVSVAAAGIVGTVLGVIAGTILSFIGVIVFGVSANVIYASAREGGWYGRFLTFFGLLMLTACLCAAYGMARYPSWGLAGPLLVFLGLLTFINALFDWASLGLTRALLRRGLELKGWWPLALALIDAASAALIVALLAIAMVISVQSFDTLAVLGGGTAVLPLDPLFAGLRDPKTALEPEYWWIYVLFLTTLIPSLINLGIGGASMIQMLPLGHSWLLKKLPADKPVRTYDRTLIAVLLVSQGIGGMLLGFLVQAAIFWLVIGRIMALFGLGLLDMAEGIAALDLPARLLSLWLPG
ncbi:conserved membrane hypothetical protein [Candidatus Defluviicoccus seviourii]|uniref:Uncharacterized protein n=2 Tax=root TaxID=1 RepID=A0A564W9Y1_9PROT|nr:conserved membrane hypothetical protein [uncultured Defluviicoccus sp.]VUX45283.1 conserved membrane hypothetical protein [Candidatus Defluviicoccus seviourii]